MAFFKNFPNQTVSHGIMEENSRAQCSMRNEDVGRSFSERIFDMNLDGHHTSDGEPSGASRVQKEAVADNGIRENNLQPSVRRTANAGKWGSTFWKDCQPMCPPEGSDSGQDSKSGSDCKSSGRSAGDSADARESDDDGQKEVPNSQRGPSDVPADEMLSDEYYEQDGEEQIESVVFGGFNHSTRMNSIPSTRAMPFAASRNVSRNRRAVNDDDEEDDDADYEEEDNEDGDDPDEADFEPDSGVAGHQLANKDEDWDAEGSDEDNISDDDMDVVDKDDSFYSKTMKSKKGGEGGSIGKSSTEHKSLPAPSRPRKVKSPFEEDESSARDSDSESAEDFKGVTRRGGHLRENNVRSNPFTSIIRENHEVRTSTRSARKVSHVKSDDSEEVDQGKRKISQKSDNVSGLMKMSPEVAEALSNGKPVVALESCVISHGMPYPQNLDTAKQLEAIVRVNGAIPATIAIIDGVPCIGLSMEDLQKLASLGSRAQKTACRDIAYVVSIRGNGGTTVSATMFLASKVGIPILVTGGIGGVHRDGKNTLDISSDLTELGRTPVAVVSAGVNSILDIPRTLEYLGALDVCVAAYATNEFPGFFTQRSGCQVPRRVDTPEDCAQLIDDNVKHHRGRGILFAIPIPTEHSASGRFIEDSIQIAIKEARAKNIAGNAVTPFLLSRVNELTGGASLASNIALLKNNAQVGAKIAAALALLRGHQNSGE